MMWLFVPLPVRDESGLITAESRRDMRRIETCLSALVSQYLTHCREYRKLEELARPYCDAKSKAWLGITTTASVSTQQVDFACDTTLVDDAEEEEPLIHKRRSRQTGLGCGDVPGAHDGKDLR